MKEFIFSTIVVYIVGYFGYYSLFFIKFENRNVLQSNLVLWAIHILIYFLNFFITKKWDVNDKNVITTMLMGFTIYSYLTYAKYFTNIFTISAGVSFFLVAIYGVFVYCRRIPDGKNPKRIFKLRNRRMYVGIKNVVAVMGLSLMVMLFINRYVVGGLLVSSSETQYVDVVEPEEYFLQYADKFLYLTPEMWEKLNEQEKLNILQYGANYEALSLGLPSNLVLYSSNLDEGTMGYYDYEKSIIQINIDHLKNSDLEKVYQTIAHELYHGAQYAYASAYQGLDESKKKLSFFQDAAQYAKEWSQYKSAEKAGYEAYYTQQLESDARAYAIMAWHRIEGRIELYQWNIEPIEETTKERSIDDVTVLKGPLVKRETTNYSSGVTWISEYSYDSKNRYETIESYKIAAGTEEPVLYSIDNYSYDDSFFYRDTEYFQEEKLVTRNIFDVYGNAVQGQFVAGMVVRTDAFCYQYLCDTNKRQEVIVTAKYALEKDTERAHIFCGYNDYGDMIYLIDQEDEHVTETTWDYEYDENNRIIKIVEENKYSYNLRCEIKETTYQYDDSGKLVIEIENYISNPIEKPDEITYQITTFYKYDSQDRLVQCRSERTSLDQEASVTVTEYEYQEEEEMEEISQEL